MQSVQSRGGVCAALMAISLALWQRRSRWTVLIAACWVEATAGLSYVFSTYSPALKSELSYDQRHINRLSVAKDLGDTVGLAAGFLCRILPNWAVLLLGALLILAGYGSLWLLTDHLIPALPFWLVCILIFMGTNGCTYLDTAALVACIPNFPSNRATAVGILKGFKGLCGAIFNQIYASFLTPDATSFILLLALGPAVVIIPLIFLMGPISAIELTRNEEDDTSFRLLYAASLLLAAYMLTVTLLQDLSSVSYTVNIVFTVLLFLILLLPLPVPTIADRLSKRHKENDGHVKDPLLGAGSPDCEKLENESSRKPLFSFSNLSRVAPNESVKEGTLVQQKVAESISKVELAGTDITLWKAFVSVNFWLLVFSIFCSLGSGTTAFNNLSQMGQALGYTNTQVFVSMTNIWNFAGRLAGGYASEITTRHYAQPRILLLAVAQLIMVVGHVLFAVGWPGAIYVAVFLVATGYGAHWAIFPTALSELFGLQNFGVLYNFVNMASPAGSLIYSGFIAGPVYDWQAKKQSGASTSDDDTTLVCEGTVCFEITFFVMAGVCLMGAAMSMVLAMRTRTLYSRIH